MMAMLAIAINLNCFIFIVFMILENPNSIDSGEKYLAEKANKYIPMKIMRKNTFYKLSTRSSLSIWQIYAIGMPLAILRLSN